MTAYMETLSVAHVMVQQPREAGRRDVFWLSSCNRRARFSYREWHEAADAAGIPQDGRHDLIPLRHASPSPDYPERPVKPWCRLCVRALAWDAGVPLLGDDRARGVVEFALIDALPAWVVSDGAEMVSAAAGAVLEALMTR